MSSSHATHEYDSSFYQWVESTSKISAERIVPFVQDIFNPSSVLDVGCGSGAWLNIWNKIGVSDYTGLDGAYVLKSPLRIPRERFVASDLANSFNCSRSFDLVQSLEVAEHIPPEKARIFVDALAAHGDIILFSAAQPGQGGEHHVNEQSPEYWRKLFTVHGYRMFDVIRPQFVNDNAIAPWYRYNTFVFVRGAGLAKFGQTLNRYDITDVRKISSFSPLLWRLRCGILSLFPVSFITWLSRMRYQFMNSLRKVS
jgi:SAM-dependent methyltransferase